MKIVKDPAKRKKLAQYLRLWRKTRFPSEMAKILNVHAGRISEILRLSPLYVKIARRDAKKKASKWFKTKNSDYRNKIAKVLFLWRKYHSSIKVAKELKSNKKTILILLNKTRAFKRSIHFKSNREQLLIKNSPYRRELASYLIAWRKNYYNVRMTAKYLDEGFAFVLMHLSETNAYKRFKNFNTKMKETKDSKEIIFILRMAKKLAAVRLLGGKCCNCGETNIAVLDFHHVDRQTKDEIISRLNGNSWQQLLKEIYKCKLLCRNCHALEHFQLKLLKDNYSDIVYKSLRFQKCNNDVEINDRF